MYNLYVFTKCPLMVRVKIVQQIAKYYFQLLEKNLCIPERKLGNIRFLTAIVFHVPCFIQFFVSFTSMTVVVL